MTTLIFDRSRKLFSQYQQHDIVCGLNVYPYIIPWRCRLRPTPQCSRYLTAPYHPSEIKSISSHTCAPSRRGGRRAAEWPQIVQFKCWVLTSVYGSERRAGKGTWEEQWDTTMMRRDQGYKSHTHTHWNHSHTVMLHVYPAVWDCSAVLETDTFIGGDAADELYNYIINWLWITWSPLLLNAGRTMISNG